MANIQERYGTESEQPDDRRKISTLWKYTPTSYDNEKIIELPYAMFFNATINPGVQTYQQYKINSTYDPDLTNAGFQPLGRDTWATIYNYYKVLETYVEVTVCELTNVEEASPTSNSYPSLHGFCADITAAPPTNINAWLMNSMASNANNQQILSDIQMFDVVRGRGQKPIKMTYKWNASQFDTSIIDNTKNEWTAVGGDPANINYFSLICYNPTAGTRNVVAHVKLTYLVAFKQVSRNLLNTVN